MAERDYIAATRERIVVFDGGMGATLEQFDLTQEDYGGLRGQMPRGARPQPARRDRGRPRLDDRGRRRGGRDRHLPGLAAEARRVGPGRAHAGDQHQGGRNRPQGGGRGALRRRLDRPDRVPARLRPTRPSATSPSRKLVEVFAEQATGLVAGRRRPDHHRDRAGHPRGEGGDLRRPRGLRGDRPQAAAPDQRLPPPPGRQDAARHRHPGRADDADRARRRRDRAQLLDRARGHARRDPLPGRDQPAAGPLHPQRRPAAAGARRRDDLPREARAAGRDAGRVRRALRRRHRRRLLRHDARAHRRDPRAGRRPRPRRAPGRRPDRGLLDDDLHPAGPGAAPDPGRRAGQLAGLAQGEGAAARRRLRRPRPGRRGPGRRWRPRARRLRGADRAPGRGRADGGRGQADLADPAGADPGRLDRAGGDQGGAGADPRPGDRQLDQPRGGPRQGRRRRAAGEGARRGADRADDRRGRDGEDGRAQGRDRQTAPRHRLRRPRPRPRGADLRRAHLHADHRR